MIRTQAAGGVRLSATQLKLIALCSLVYLMDGMGGAILGPIAPGMAKALSVSKVELGPVFSASLLGQCIGLVVIPLLQVRFGHRLLIVASMFGFSLAVIATAFAQNTSELIALRLLTGLGLGGALPSTIALLADHLPTSRRGTGIMLLFVAYGAGPIVAGLLAELCGAQGWREALLVGGGLSLLAAAADAKWLREPPLSSQIKVLAQGAVRAGTKSGPRALFSRDLRVGTMLIWSMFINCLVVNYCLSSWLPTLLANIGRSHTVATISVSAFAIGGVVSSLSIGPIIDRFGSVPTLMVCFIASALLLLVAGLGLETFSDTVLLIVLVGAGFFELGAYGGANVVLVDYYPAELRAVGVGWAKTVARLGTIVAPVLIGLALTAGVSVTRILEVFSIPALLAGGALAGIGFLLSRRKRRIEMRPDLCG